MYKCIFLISKDTLNWSKVTVNNFIIFQNIYISNKFYSFYLAKNTEKMYHGFQIQSNIDNYIKSVLSTKSVYLQ